MLKTDLSILQQIKTNRLNNGNKLFIKRDDLIHPEISGNKWRKLKYNVLHVKQVKKEGILTFGGAYSNHLVATAAACQLVGLKAVGIVRGQELNAFSNDTLHRCKDYGMMLDFVSRDEYNLKNERHYHEQLLTKYPNFQIIPEGGSNYLGIIGCQEILSETTNDFDIIALAQGTTTTSAGVLMSADKTTRVWGIPVLKSYDSKTEIRSLFERSGFDNETISELLSNYMELNQYHFGGYASYTDELLDFIDDFYLETSIPLDPVYTAKAMFGLLNELNLQNIQNKRILFIHTGGLQGAKAIFDKEKRPILR